MDRGRPRGCRVKLRLRSGGKGCGAMLSGVLLVVLAMLGVAPVTAAYLAIPNLLSLEAGEHLLQPLALFDVRQIRIQIALGEAPPGARLTVDDNGRMLVDWQTSPDLPAETRIEILLSDVDTGRLLERRNLTVRRVDPVAVPSTPVAASSAAVPAPDAVPQLSALASQVISAGFVVSMRVDATLPEGLTPVLQVDRLPNRASFDANADGSRTFYWRTDKKDEGEHVFRFTAINPADTHLRASREVMIVVGDPTRKTIRPEEATGSQQ